MMTKDNKTSVFLSRRVRLKANEAAIVSLRINSYIEINDNKQVCIITNLNCQSAAIL